MFGALCPSKSGLMNKHIVKHIGRYRWADRTTHEVYKAPQIWTMSTIVTFLEGVSGWVAAREREPNRKFPRPLEP